MPESVLSDATPCLPALQLAKENHLIVDLLDRYIIVLDTREECFHIVQLVIVRGKKRTGMGFLVLVDVLYDGPCNGDAVIRGSAAPQLIKQHQASGREVVQDISGFIHLDHECRFTHRYVVACSYTGKYLVYQPDMRTFGCTKQPI